MRGRHMCGKPEFLGHSDFATVVIAPNRFIDRYRSQCALFDVVIPHEGIAAFLPAFSQ